MKKSGTVLASGWIGRDLNGKISGGSCSRRVYDFKIDAKTWTTNIEKVYIIRAESGEETEMKPKEPLMPTDVYAYIDPQDNKTYHTLQIPGKGFRLNMTVRKCNLAIKHLAAIKRFAKTYKDEDPMGA